LAFGGLLVVTTNNPVAVYSYAMVNTILLGAVSLGGVLKYTSRESVDFRDIYREKDRLQKQKIEELKMRIVDLEKEKIKHEQSSTEPTPGYVDVIVNGGMEN
jgi:hypothetical protein